jgi:hypothetical protein
MVFVMTTANGGYPSGYFAYKETNETPPWAFTGYQRMTASTEENAEQEFRAALAAFDRDE